MKKSFFKHLFVFLALLAIFLPLVNFASAEDDILNNLTNAVRETGLKGTRDLPLFIGRIIQFFLGFLAIIFVAMLIYAGFLYLTAGGDSGKASKAKDMIRNAIIGVIIVLAAYAITVTVITKVQEAMTGGTTQGAGTTR